MKNKIKEKFNEITEKNINWSSYLCFAETIQKVKLKSKNNLRTNFNLLVERDDYARSEKRKILKFLYGLSNI